MPVVLRLTNDPVVSAEADRLGCRRDKFARPANSSHRHDATANFRQRLRRRGWTVVRLHKQSGVLLAEMDRALPRCVGSDFGERLAPEWLDPPPLIAFGEEDNA